MDRLPPELLNSVLLFLAPDAGPTYDFITNYSLVCREWKRVMDRFFVLPPHLAVPIFVDGIIGVQDGEEEEEVEEVEEVASKGGMTVEGGECGADKEMVDLNETELKFRAYYNLWNWPCFCLRNKDRATRKEQCDYEDRVMMTLSRMRTEKLVWCNESYGAQNLHFVFDLLQLCFTRLKMKTLVISGLEQNGVHVLTELINVLKSKNHTLEHILLIGGCNHGDYVSDDDDDNEHDEHECDEKTSLSALIRNHGVKLEGIWTDHARSKDLSLVSDIGSVGHETIYELVTNSYMLNDWTTLNNGIISDLKLIKSFIPNYQPFMRVFHLDINLGGMFIDIMTVMTSRLEWSTNLRESFVYCLNMLRDGPDESMNTQNMESLIDSIKQQLWNRDMWSLLAPFVDMYRFIELLLQSQDYDSGATVVVQSAIAFFVNDSIDLQSIRCKTTGDTIVHLIVAHGNVKSLKRIRDHIAPSSLDLRNSNNESALFTAARFNKFQMFVPLIKGQCDPFATNASNETFLDVALHHGDHTILKYFISESKWKSKFVNNMSQSWWCLLIDKMIVTALETHNFVNPTVLQAISLLSKLWKGERTNWLRTYGDQGSSIIQLACAGGNPEVLVEFLDSTLFVPDEATRIKLLFHDLDGSGSSAFHHACQPHQKSGDKVKSGLVSLILRNYAPSHSSAEVLQIPNALGQTPMQIARSHQMHSVLKVLQAHLDKQRKRSIGEVGERELSPSKKPKK